MDNIAFHHSSETHAALRAAGLAAMYIPPYSPRFNAIEYVFAKLKHVYRALCPWQPSEAQSFDYLRAIETAIESLGRMDAYFDHVDRSVAEAFAADGEGVSGYDA